MTKASPKSAALAYRIWAYAEPRGWDVTLHEVADALGASPSWIGRIATAKGWNSRLRANERDYHVGVRARDGKFITTDYFLEDLQSWS